MTLSPRVPSSRWFQWHSRCTWVELPSSFCDTDVTCGEITQHIQLQRGLLSPGGKQQLKCWQWSAARDPCLRVLSLIGLSGGREEEPRAMIWPLITLNKEPELLLYTGSHSEKVEGYHFKQERPCSAGQGDKGGGEKYGCQWPPYPLSLYRPHIWNHKNSLTRGPVHSTEDPGEKVGALEIRFSFFLLWKVCFVKHTSLWVALRERPGSLDHIQALEASLTLNNLPMCSAGLKVMALESWSKFGAEVRVHKPIKLASQTGSDALRYRPGLQGGFGTFLTTFFFFFAILLLYLDLLLLRPTSFILP